jgi:transcription elongation factor GreA
MAEDQYLTQSGAEDLRAELEELINVKRPALARQLKDAISQGDLSENADYVDAKEQQAFLEGRIMYLENLLRNASIIDDLGASSGKAPSEVELGCEVTITAEGESPETYRIVGAAEADPRNGKISNESPMGSALLGRKVGEVVVVDTPGGAWEVKIAHIAR